MMNEYNKIYKSIIDRLFEGKEFIAEQIMKHSEVSGYDHALRSLDIKIRKEFVEKLITPYLVDIKSLFEIATQNPVDILSINNDVKLTDKKTLESIISEEEHIPEEEATKIVRTIEATLEEEVFEEAEVKPEDIVKLRFWNDEISDEKVLYYVKGDHKFKEDISLGWMFAIILIGIPTLIRGYKRKNRLMKLLRQIDGVIYLKYVPATKNTVKLVNKLQEYKEIK